MDTPDEHERFMRLFLAHEPEILRAVLVFVPQPADARDVVQETAVALWKHFPDYDPSRPFGVWARGFARLEVRKFLRRMYRRAMLTERAAASLIETDEALAGESEERERHLAECRAKLPADHRSVLDAYYVEEAAVETVAERHGRSVEAIYKLLQRIRCALHNCMDRKMAEARG